MTNSNDPTDRAIARSQARIAAVLGIEPTFGIGDRVLYRGSWGTGPAQPGTIIGDGIESNATVYDVQLESGETKWGYADQFELVAD